MLSNKNSQRELLARSLMETTVFSDALRYIRNQNPTDGQLQAWFSNYYPGQKGTAHRRYSTFTAYLKDAQLVDASAVKIRASRSTIAVEKIHNKIQSGIAGKPVKKEALEAIKSTSTGTIKFEISSQKRERANQVHWNLVVAKTAFLKARSLPADDNRLVDLFSSRHADTIIYEMKSLSGKNLSSQIRHAVAQLYEYRYIFSQPKATLCIVTNSAISKTDSWVTDYLATDRNIAYEWTEDFESFSCTKASKTLLADFAP
jgi:hypothetical protein